MKAALVSAVVFGLLKVMLKVLLAPVAMLARLNTWLTVGGLSVLISLLLLYQAVTAAVLPVSVMLVRGAALIVSLAGGPVTAVA